MDLVIGGSGFIGYHVVKELLARGRRVRVFDLMPFPMENCATPTESVQGDIRDLDALKGAMRGCDRVFHLAANPRLWDRNSRVFDEVNRLGTENVIAAIRDSDVSRLVYTSTESILLPRASGNGNSNGGSAGRSIGRSNGRVTEKTRTRLDDMIGTYCRSKFLAQEAVLEFAAEGFPVVLVNPTLPVGPGDRNLTPPGYLIKSYMSGKLKGYLDCRLNFVDVRDVAIGHVLAAQGPADGQLNLLSGRSMQLKDFFVLLEGASGVRAPTLEVPYFAALGFSYVEELFGSLTGRRPLSSVTGVKLSRRSWDLDGSATWRKLGHSPRPLEDSVRDAVAWFRSMEYLN